MPIPFHCSQCGTPHNAPDQLAGKKIKCKGCGSVEQVPPAGGAAKPAAAKPTAPKQPTKPAAGTPRANPSPAVAPRAAKPSPAAQPSPRPAVDQKRPVSQQHVTPPQPVLGAMPAAPASEAFANLAMPAAPFQAPYQPGYGAYHNQPRRRGMSPVILVLLVGGAMAGLGMLCVVAGAVWWFSQSRGPEGVANVPSPLDASPRPGPPRPPQAGARPPVPQRSGPGGAGPVSSGPGNAGQGPNSSNRQNIATPTSSGPVDPIDNWPKLSAAVPADPMPESQRFTFAPAGAVSFPLPDGSSAHYPEVPSPFVAIVTDRPQKCQVWDLRTLESVASAPVELRGSAAGALSPGGKHFAYIDRGSLQIVTLSGGSKQSMPLKPPIQWIGLTDDAAMAIDQNFDPQQKKPISTVHVYDLASGKTRHEFPLDGILQGAVARSGGGKYLAAVLTQPKGQVLQIVDLTKAAPVAEATMPHIKDNMLMPVAVAFSPDGKELTWVLQQGVNLRLATWDLASGEMVAQCGLDHQSNPWLVNRHQYRGPVIEALDDGSGWLVAGIAVVDRQSGRVRQTLPDDFGVRHNQIQRRVFGNNQMLLAGTNGSTQVLTNQLSLAQDLKAQGQSLAQGVHTRGNQTAMNADLASAKKIEIPGGSIKWQVEPDPLPPAKGGLGAKPVELKGRGDEPASYHFSSPDIGLVAVFNIQQKGTETTTATGNSAADAVRARIEQRRAELAARTNQDQEASTQPTWIDRYDLVDGKHLGRLNLEPGCVMHDLSPKGDLAIVQNKHAVQIWSLADNKQIGQWAIPFLDSTTKNFKTFCRFAGNDHVLARVDKNRVAVWHLPDCKPVYVLDKVESMVPQAEQLSPGGKYLMTYLQQPLKPAMVAFIETLTGELRGVAAASTLMGSEAVTVVAGRFRPDGEQATLSIVGGNFNSRTMIDLKTGRVFSDLSYRGVFFWPGNRYIFESYGLLYDIAYRHTVWRYGQKPGTKPLLEAPGGRMWFATLSGGPQSSVWLAATEIPSAADARQIDAMFAGKKPLLDKGTRVSLEVACDGPGDMNEKVTESLKKKLSANGMEVDDGAPIRLVATANVTDSRTKEFESMRRGRDGEKSNISFNVTVVTCSVKFLGKEEKPIWETTTKVSSDPGFMISANSDIEKLEQSHWPAAGRWLLALPLPTRVYPAPDKIGTSPLEFPGVVDKSPPPQLASSSRASGAATNPNTGTAAGGAAANASDAAAASARSPLRPPFPLPASAAAAAGAASEQESRDFVAGAYVELLKQQAWDKLRTSPKLQRPLIGIRWALGTETTPQTQQRDIDSFSNYAGQYILDGLAGRSMRGEFGEFPRPTDARLTRPVLVGVGQRGKLLAAAKQHWADLLLVADAETRLIGLSKRTDTSVVMRVIDVATGKQLWNSEPLKQLNATIGRQFTDYVLKHCSEAYPVKPIDSLTAESAATRAEAILAKDFNHPLAVLAEIGYYEHKQWIETAKAAELYQAVLGSAEGKSYAAGDAAKRAELVEAWLPKWTTAD